jgi:hypothetical protein
LGRSASSLVGAGLTSAAPLVNSGPQLLCQSTRIQCCNSRSALPASPCASRSALKRESKHTNLRYLPCRCVALCPLIRCTNVRSHLFNKVYAVRLAQHLHRCCAYIIHVWGSSNVCGKYVASIYVSLFCMLYEGGAAVAHCATNYCCAHTLSTTGIRHGDRCLSRSIILPHHPCKLPRDDAAAAAAIGSYTLLQRLPSLV